MCIFAIMLLQVRISYMLELHDAEMVRDFSL